MPLPKIYSAKGSLSLTILLVLLEGFLEGQLIGLLAPALMQAVRAWYDVGSLPYIQRDLKLKVVFSTKGTSLPELSRNVSLPLPSPCHLSFCSVWGADWGRTSTGLK